MTPFEEKLHEAMELAPENVVVVAWEYREVSPGQTIPFRIAPGPSPAVR